MDYSLYLVTDRRFMGKQTLAEAVEQAILGGCTMVQLREKELSSLGFLLAGNKNQADHGQLSHSPYHK